MALAIILSTYPDMDTARGAARRAIESELAACVNMARISSIYRWKGEVVEEDEILALFKTTDKAAPKLKDAILESHPYDVPELVELDAESAGPYMDWVAGSVSVDRVPQQRDDAAES